jgi:hypothetical protein
VKGFEPAVVGIASFVGGSECQHVVVFLGIDFQAPNPASGRADLMASFKSFER